MSEERVDESARRVLKEKFLMGLFDDPFVDAERAAEVVGREDFVREGEVSEVRVVSEDKEVEEGVVEGADEREGEEEEEEEEEEDGEGGRVDGPNDNNGISATSIPTPCPCPCRGETRTSASE